MADAGTIVAHLDANDVKLLRKLQRATRETKKTARSMNRTMTRAMRSMSQAARSFGLALGVAFGVQQTRQIVEAGLAMDRFNRTFKVATGSAKVGAQEMEYISELANELGVDLLVTADAYAKLTAAAKGTSLAGQNTRDIFASLAKATTVLGLSAADAGQILTAVEQMISKGKVSAEELRRQMQKLPGAFQIAARAMGVTTAELDKMLKNGELMAVDLLPKLSMELDKTFGGGVEEAANSAQASFARFSNAILEIKAAIAESGVMEALANLAQGIANVVNPGLQLDIQQTQEHLLALTARAAELGVLMAKGSGPNTMAAWASELWSVNRAITAADIKMEELNKKIARAHLPEFGEAGAGDAGPVDSTALDAFAQRFETAEQKVKRLREELAGFKDDMNPAEYARIFNKIGEELTSGLEEIEVKTREMSDKLKRLYEVEMSEYAKEAARNIQDAFSDFLFDPFDKGVKGMVEGFLTAIRRMMANKAAANIMESGFFSGLFGGARADGGPVSSGKSYLVGERGPELFTPNQSGAIIPNGAGGSMVVNQNYHIEAGADWQTLQKILPPMFEQNQDATLAKFLQLRAEGAV